MNSIEVDKIGNFIKKNYGFYTKLSKLTFFVYGSFPTNFLNEPIDITISQNSDGFILSINEETINIFVPHSNHKAGKSKKRKNISKKIKKSKKSKKSKKRKIKQNGGNNQLITALFVLIVAIYLNNAFFKEDIKLLSKSNPWEKNTTDINILFETVVPQIRIINKTSITDSLLDKSLTRGLILNNTKHIVTLPKSLIKTPLSYAEFNISKLPAHTEMMSMFKKISFTTKVPNERVLQYRLMGTWKIEEGTVSIQIVDHSQTETTANRDFPQITVVDEIAGGYVKESIQIEKKIGMIRTEENEGQFILLLANIFPRSSEIPDIHQDRMFVPNSERFVEYSKKYTIRDPHQGQIVSLMYPDTTEVISQPSFLVDSNNNPIYSTTPKREPYYPLTKYIEGTKATTDQVQIHDQSQGIYHEAVGTAPPAPPAPSRRRLLNLAIMPIELKNTRFNLPERKTHTPQIIDDV